MRKLLILKMDELLPENAKCLDKKMAELILGCLPFIRILVIDDKKCFIGRTFVKLVDPLFRAADGNIDFLDRISIVNQIMSFNAREKLGFHEEAEKYEECLCFAMRRFNLTDREVLFIGNVERNIGCVVREGWHYLDVRSYDELFSALKAIRKALS